jgi:ABC-type cobalt transport system substrate-binding protein
MPAPKPLSKEDILRAMRFTKSNRAAARYLGVSYQHYKPWAKLYKMEDGDIESLSLFELHKNQSGKGIPKFLPNRRKDPNVKEIIETGTGWESFTPEKIKSRLIAEAYLKDECYSCGFNERRVTDYKAPLLLRFKDDNKCNYLLENLELHCYNCYFLYVADPLTQNQIRHIEDNTEVKTVAHEWDLSPEQIENMKALGLWDDDDDDEEPGDEFIAYTK